MLANKCSYDIEVIFQDEKLSQKTSLQIIEEKNII
jgi:hypothetical protein